MNHALLPTAAEDARPQLTVCCSPVGNSKRLPPKSMFQFEPQRLAARKQALTGSVVGQAPKKKSLARFASDPINELPNAYVRTQDPLAGTNRNQ
jgi:hypothetical protein